MSADAILTTGSTFIRTVSITNDDGTPYDLTGAGGVFAAFTAPTPYAGVENELTVLDAEAGTAQVELSAIITAGMPAPAWVEMEIRVEDSDGKLQPVGKYTIRTEPGAFS